MLHSKKYGETLKTLKKKIEEQKSSSKIKKNFKILIGDKVILKPFVKSDITKEYISWLNDPVVVQYSNQRFMKHTRDSCKKYLKSFQGTKNMFLKIQTKEGHLFVGTMTAYVSGVHRTVDIGIMVGRRSAWGTGIGQDAWNTLKGWLNKHKQMRKITGGAMQCNRAMIKIFKRSGMKQEAVRCGQELLNGFPKDIHYYAEFIN